MRLVAGIDDRSLHHCIEIDQTFEEIGSLGNLILGGVRLILRPDFSGPGVNRSRHQERQQDLYQTVEGHRAGQQIILVVSVAVPLAVRIVLIEKKLLVAAGLGHRAQAGGKKALPGALEGDHLPRVRAFRRGIFRMRAVHIQPPAVGQGLVQQPVVFGARPLALALDFEAAGVEQRILVFVIPDRLRRRQRRALSDQLQRMRDRIERLDVPGGDSEFRFCSNDTYHAGGLRFVP